MKRRQHLRSLLEQVGETLWVWPAAAIVVGFSLGVALVEIEADGARPLLFAGDVAAGRDVLLSIIAVTFTVTATVFSFILIVLQLAATQFSPRSLRTFVRDNNTKTSLAVFMGLIAYAAAVLIRASDGREEAPALAVSLALMFTLVAVVMLAFLIHHTAQSVRIEHLMRSIADDTMGIVSQVGTGMQDASAAPTADAAPEDARAILAVATGYVQGIDVERLLAVSEEHGVRISLRPRVGDHCIAGLPLADVWRQDGTPVGSGPVNGLRDGIARAVDIGFERTMVQDVAFGLRQLVDMAIRAMSPAINDPRSAVEATLHLSRILCALASTPLAPIVGFGRAAEQPAVIVHRLDFGDYVGLACDEIRRFGTREPSVAAALLTLLEQVAWGGRTPEHLAVLTRHLDLVLDDSRRVVEQPADLVALEARAEQVREALSSRPPT